MAKQKSLKSLKKDLWKITSEFVRLNYSDINGFVYCVTCGNPMSWNGGAQAGHFIPKAQGNSIYFDLRNVHPQDHRCNINLGSNGPEYFRFMQGKYGDELIEELRRNAKKTLKLTSHDYLDMIEEVKGWMKELQERRRNGNYESMRVNFAILEQLEDK